jgi:hypothetical protein
MFAKEKNLMMDLMFRFFIWQPGIHLPVQFIYQLDFTAIAFVEGRSKMGNNNPGKYRKEGREAFEPECDPENSCPYSHDVWSHREDWFEGWREAEAMERAERAQQAEYDEDNWEINSIAEAIENLQADPALIDILKDMLKIIEEIKNE